MASTKSTEHEAHVGALAPPADAEFDEHGLVVLRVNEGDKADPDPRHAGPDKLGLPGTPFDPNAALRNKQGRRPGLQDSEAKNPAVWVDETSDASRAAAADAHVQDAELALKQAKDRAAKLKKGEPLGEEIP